MSNYIEYNDTIAFHPGYYIKEIIDGNSVLTLAEEEKEALEIAKERNI